MLCGIINDIAVLREDLRCMYGIINIQKVFSRFNKSGIFRKKSINNNNKSDSITMPASNLFGELRYSRVLLRLLLVPWCPAGICTKEKFSR